MATRTLEDLVRQELGVVTFTRDNPEISSAGLTAAVVLRQNPNRVAFTIVNLSTVNMFIRPLADPSASAGILIAPNGGSVLLDWKEDFDLVGYEWRIVAAAAASPLFALEWILLREPGG